jgi:hypothetical protein
LQSGLELKLRFTTVRLSARIRVSLARRGVHHEWRLEIAQASAAK